MGIILADKNDNYKEAINFWHWRTIVETIRRLEVLDDKTVDGLHAPFMNNGLSKDQARSVAAILREKVLSTLKEGERLKIDGTITSEPDDGTFYHLGDPSFDENYSTNRKVLESFIDFCEKSGGFDVN